MLLLANALPFLQWMVDFIHWAKGMGAAGGALYAVVYIAGTALFFPGLPLTLGAGFLYGALIGTLVVSPASVAGATLAFLIARYLARDWVTRRIKKYPQAAAIDRAIEKNGFKAVVLLRLQPVLPFNILNYALGLTSIRLRDYMLASWIGMFPATVLYVYLGSVMNDISDLLRGRPNSGMAGRLLLWAGLAAIVALVWWLGRIARKALREEMGTDSPSSMKQ
ncbi:MAG TPA: TVP38/TMEM64 family protein [Blattabacteriaceae bacterium]|nr:TVP38/TMEM64 family protein [Blattabacteriaceae bacterium]